MRACWCRSTPACRIEQRYFTEIMQTTEAATMIRSLFVSLQELNKGARRPAGVADDQVQEDRRGRRRLHGRRHRLCHGQGRHSGRAGRPRPWQSAEKGKAHSDGLISDADQEGPRQAGGQGKAAVADHADRRLRRPRRLRPRHRGGVRGFARSRRRRPRRPRRCCKPAAIFASNTSTMPITGACRRTPRGPKNFIGIHFFSPVDKMMLVEIILGKKTGDKALADGDRLCARHQEDADRRQRHARLLRQPLRAALHVRSLSAC